MNNHLRTRRSEVRKSSSPHAVSGDPASLPTPLDPGLRHAGVTSVWIPRLRPRGMTDWMRMAILLFPFAWPLSAGAALSIRVSGNQLVDGNGQTIRLLGVNEPGLEYACVEPGGAGYGIFADPAQNTPATVFKFVFDDARLIETEAM